MKSRISLSAALLLATLAVGAAPALAALSGEVNSGRAVAARLDSGQATCKNLSSTQFEHLGEYVMQRMLGSRALHESMDRRMETMMGSEYADRMHQALGRRYAGCPINRSTLGPGMMGGGSGMMMGGGSGMMGGSYSGGRGWGGMMGSGYAWMRNGSWQHMNRANWQHALNYMMAGYERPSGGWSAWAVIAAALGALALGGLIGFLVVRRPRHHGMSGPQTT